MSRRIRPAALIVAAVCSWSVIGCSDDAEPSDADDGSQSVDEVASSWGEIDARDVKRTRSYLSGRGASLLEYADFAANLDGRLDDEAYASRCRGLDRRWDASFARRRMVNRLYALPDPILGRLWTSQFPSAERAVRECANGARNQSAAAAEQITRIQELVDRRLEQLGVDR